MCTSPLAFFWFSREFPSVSATIGLVVVDELGAAILWLWTLRAGGATACPGSTST